MTKRKANWAKFFLLFLIVLTLLTPNQTDARTSVLAHPPDWTRLDKYQKSITREKFGRLLREYYAQNGAAYGFVWVDDDHALIRKQQGSHEFYRLNFAPSEEFRREVPVTWRPVIPGSLAGRKIALDPGHLGGQWAKMEERWYQVGDSPPVTEGDMTLLVAKKIAVKLRQAGAIVSFLRSTTAPLTSARPESFLREATNAVKEREDPLRPSSNNSGELEKQIRQESERLFYRLSEIRSRARRNNERLRPDLTICIHFNAEKWDDPNKPTFVDKNHLHLLVNGHYGSDEIAYDDVRFEMIEKLLSQSIATELTLSDTVAESLAQATRLPPYEYTIPVAGRTVESSYVWTRNLLATRLYRNPTLYLEPYVMNNQEVFDRIQMGDYEGTREINGIQRKSIYNEYADAVTDALTGVKEQAKGP